MFKYFYLLCFCVFYSATLQAKPILDRWVLTQISSKQLFEVSLSCKSSPEVGTFQSCYLKIKPLSSKYLQGKLLENAEVKVGGGMPAHHHGLPTEPVVKWSKRSKKYRIDGLKFSMKGNWLLHFYVNDKDNAIQDVASFDFTI